MLLNIPTQVVHGSIGESLWTPPGSQMLVPRLPLRRLSEETLEGGQRAQQQSARELDEHHERCDLLPGRLMPGEGPLAELHECPSICMHVHAPACMHGCVCTVVRPRRRCCSIRPSKRLTTVYRSTSYPPRPCRTTRPQVPKHCNRLLPPSPPCALPRALLVVWGVSRCMLGTQRARRAAASTDLHVCMRSFSQVALQYLRSHQDRELQRTQGRSGQTCPHRCSQTCRRQRQGTRRPRAAFGSKFDPQTRWRRPC